ncbi:MAG: hypothetical protein CXZ00_07380 [Acidobacteria bacterium]|nr:MAG: hypothetical protein CXZ00_07380 [Acidobacteriota bacterium]
MRYLVSRAIVIHEMTPRRKRALYTGRYVPITNRPRYELKKFVNAMNGIFPPEQVLGEDESKALQRRHAETPTILHEFYRVWRLSGPDAINHQCKLWREINEYWANMATQLVGVPGAGAAIRHNGRPGQTPRKEALRLFIEFLLNPECDRLAGPCARCGKYYIRGSVRNKLYCSRSCGTRSTALAATRKRRDNEHADKLRRAQKAADKWIEHGHTRLDWKTWVTRKEPDITSKFLTRAVNNGELQSPLEDKKL